MQFVQHRSDFFLDLPADAAGAAAQLGFDYEELVEAKDQLHTRLKTLTQDDLAFSGGGGFLAGFQLFGSDPALAKWLRFRRDSVTQYFSAVSEGVKSAVGRPVLMGKSLEVL